MSHMVIFSCLKVFKLCTCNLCTFPEYKIFQKIKYKIWFPEYKICFNKTSFPWLWGTSDMYLVNLLKKKKGFKKLFWCVHNKCLVSIMWILKSCSFPLCRRWYVSAANGLPVLREWLGLWWVSSTILKEFWGWGMVHHCQESRGVICLPCPFAKWLTV